LEDFEPFETYPESQLSFWTWASVSRYVLKSRCLRADGKEKERRTSPKPERVQASAVCSLARWSLTTVPVAAYDLHTKTDLKKERAMLRERARIDRYVDAARAQ
jgi:hypothetical protein